VITFRISLRAVQFCAALCALAPAAHGQTPATIARGQEIAERACGGCHAIADRPGSTVQGTAAPSFGSIAGRPPQRLQTFIMTPHRPMPGIPLSLAEVDDVVAYVQSLK
jgi:mono/diheme cytochrome c family protein